MAGAVDKDTVIFNDMVWWYGDGGCEMVSFQSKCLIFSNTFVRIINFHFVSKSYLI